MDLAANRDVECDGPASDHSPQYNGPKPRLVRQIPLMHAPPLHSVSPLHAVPLAN